MRISDWSSDVCSSDLVTAALVKRLTGYCVGVEPISGNLQCFQTLQTHIHVVVPKRNLAMESRVNDQSVGLGSRLLLGALAGMARSEEHTSELQSLMRISYAVFCLKKKTKHYNTTN